MNYTNSDSKKENRPQKQSFKKGVYLKEEEIFWEDKKRPLFGLPLSFTKYTLYEDRVSRETGILALKQDEVPLFRVMDVSLRQNVFQVVFNVGDVYLYSSDTSNPTFIIRSVLFPKQVLRLIKDHVDEERKKLNVAFMDVGMFG